MSVFSFFAFCIYNTFSFYKKRRRNTHTLEHTYYFALFVNVYLWGGGEVASPLVISFEIRQLTALKPLCFSRVSLLSAAAVDAKWIKFNYALIRLEYDTALGRQQKGLSGREEEEKEDLNEKGRKRQPETFCLLLNKTIWLSFSRNWILVICFITTDKKTLDWSLFLFFSYLLIHFTFF